MTHSLLFELLLLIRNASKTQELNVLQLSKIEKVHFWWKLNVLIIPCVYVHVQYTVPSGHQLAARFRIDDNRLWLYTKHV